MVSNNVSVHLGFLLLRNFVFPKRLPCCHIRVPSHIRQTDVRQTIPEGGVDNLVEWHVFGLWNNLLDWSLPTTCLLRKNRDHDKAHQFPLCADDGVNAATGYVKPLSRHGYTRIDGRYRIDRQNRDRIALFCHNGTVLLFLAHFLELPVSLTWSGFYSWPSSVTTIYFEEHSPKWAVPRALGVADVSHLYAAGLQPQPRGMGDRYEPYV